MDGEYKAYSYRWVVLIVFMLVLALQAYQWLTFAPIESSVAKLLGIKEKPIQATLLSTVGPLMFVFFGSLFGSIADKRGFKWSSCLGLTIIVISTVIKAITPHVIDSRIAQYWVFLLMQIGCGVGAVFLIVNLSKMPVKWFPEEQRALATGLTTMGMYIGTATGLALVPAIASIPEKANLLQIQNGLNRVLIIFSILMGVSTILFFLLAKEEPPTPSGPIPEEEVLPMRESFPLFMKLPSFRALMLVSLIGYGVYIALTVKMERIITFHGFSTSFASFVASAITIAGIVGAAVLPGLSEKVGLRKPFLIIAALTVLPTLILIGFIANRPLAIIAGATLGFFLLPALPITFTITAEIKEIGTKLAGTAVGTLMGIGSIGSVAAPVLMDALAKQANENVYDYRISMVALIVIAIIGTIVVFIRVPETGPRKKV